MTDAIQSPDDRGPSQADSSTAEVPNKQPGLHTRFECLAIRMARQSGQQAVTILLNFNE